MTRILVGCLLLLISGALRHQSASAQPKPPPFNPPPPFPSPLDPPPPVQPDVPLITDPPVKPPLTLEEIKAQAERHYKEFIAGILQKHCYSCHGDKKGTAGINLQQLKPDFVDAASRDKWQRVLDRVRYDEMPPRKPGTPVDPESETHLANLRLVASLSPVFAELRRLEFDPELRLNRIQILPDDGRRLSLQKQLRNAAAVIVLMERDQYELGKVTLGEVMLGLTTLEKAEYTLATTREQRIAAVQQAIAFAREMEDSVYARFLDGTEDESSLLMTKSARLAAQLKLRAENDRK